MTAIEPLLQQPAARAVGWALLHFVWQGAVVAALTAAALAILRRSAADVRYVVATIGMSLMLTLPIVTGAQKWQAAQRSPARGLPAISASTTAPDTVRIPSVDHVTARVDPAPAATLTRSVVDRIVTTSAPRLEPVLPMLLLVWLLGVTVLSLRLLTGWLWIQRLRTRGVRPASESWQKMAARLARRLHISRPIGLLESTLVDVPTVIGWMKPVVLLPASALAGLAPFQLEAVLAHELAHIRRHDYMVNLLQTLVETLLFYHPAVWWLSARIRTERENCCDDLAVSLCGDPVAYASTLADLESLRGGGSLAMAANGGSLLNRVRRLLGAPTSHAGRGPAWLAGSAAIILICGMAVGADGLRQGQASTPVAQRKAATTPRATPSDRADQTPGTAAAAAAAKAEDELTRAQRDALRAEEARIAILSDAMRADAADAADRAAALARVSSDQQEMIRAQEGLRATTAALTDQSEALAAHAAVLASTMPTQAEPVLAQAAALADAAAQSVHSTQHESSGNWIWSNNGEKLAVTYNGSFDFTDDDADVRDISAGGSLKVSDQAWLGRHTVEIADRNGTIERRYYVNGSERPFEPEGRQWLRDHLQKFVRSTGIGAERRVARILKSGGPSAVMEEISRIEGAYGKRLYFSELLKQTSLTADQYRQVMLQASREIHGDYELASLLISIADRLPADDASRAAYFTAAGGISSDYEQRRVYAAMLKRGPVSSTVLVGILDHATTIQSDYELSELLRQIVQQQPLDERTRPAFFKAAATLQSDYERRRVLSSVLRTSALDEPTLRDLLDRASQMSSDYETASFLVDVLKMNGAEGQARAPFFRAVTHIKSSYERGRVLQTLLKKPGLSQDTILEVLKTAADMPSNYDRAQILLLVASTFNLTGNLRDAYIDAADKLGSYEQGQVMTALVKSERRR